MFRSSKRSPKSRCSAPRFRPCVEALEPRALMAAGASMSGTTLIVNGTSGDDGIVVAPTGTPGQVSVTINGTSYGTFTPNSATVSGLDGSDDIVVSGVAATVIGGGGDHPPTPPGGAGGGGGGTPGHHP